MTRHSKLIVFGTVFLIAALGCEKKKRGGHAIPKEDGTKISAKATGPTRVLRYQLKVGDEMTASMDVKVKIKAEGQSMPMNIGLEMKTKVEEVLASGDARLSFTFVDFKMDLKGMPGGEQAKGMIDDMLEDMKKVKSTGTVSPRGEMKDFKFDTSGTSNPLLGQVSDMMGQQFSQMNPIFPEDAVGAGSKWMVTQPMTQSGMTIRNSVEYVVKSIEGETVTLAMTIAQEADKQTVKMPGGMGMSADLESLSSSGTGEMVFALNRPLPTTMKMDLSSDAKMVMELMGEKHKVKTSTTMTMTMKELR